jgi:hypothetical protein
MADIELVIKIPEELYTEYLYIQLGRGSGKGIVSQLLRAIKDGTPLPKGHGRLKDIDAFITKVKSDREHSAYTRSWTADDVLDALNNSYIPTIIEADKIESEDEE